MKKISLEALLPQTDDYQEQSVTKFSFDLAKKEFSKHQNENLMISPLSLYENFVIALNGANGETQEETLKVLYAENMSKANGLSAMKLGYALNIANSIWVNEKKAHILPEYAQNVEELFGAEICNRVFNNSTVDEINEWASEKTNGMINHLIDQLDSDNVAHMINAIAFEDEWLTPYTEDEIVERNFTDWQGNVQRKYSLNRWSDSCNYFDMKNADCMVKPYKNEQLSFVAIRPNDGVNLNDFIANLNADEYLKQYKTAHKPDSFHTIIPEFEYDCTLAPKPELVEMGIRRAFDGSGTPDTISFDSIADVPIYISDILHKTYIKVDRAGTKAASVTYFGMMAAGSAGEPKEIEIREVILDRPFLYMVVDTETGMPVFMGTVNEIP
jgi:serpin B